MTRVAYIGNFGPEHSTENEIRKALAHLGHEVTMIQEDDSHGWKYLLGLLAAGGIEEGDRPELVLWTRTKSLSEQIEMNLRGAVLEVAAASGVPTVGYHLDRWWGLTRQTEIETDPFFRVSTLVTADGGHDKEWADVGVNHLWMPPAVSEFECRPGTFDEAYASDIAFVGSWQGGYHHEWGHRDQLVGWLMATYGDRCRFWPQQGQHAVRGAPLRDLYASVKVVVGDSCLVPNADGTPAVRYWSDRIPETLGRGGVLIHPFVEGLVGAKGWYIPGVHLLTWNLGEWDELHRQIEFVLSCDDTKVMREDARRHTLNQHTYTVRMRELWEVLGL